LTDVGADFGSSFFVSSFGFSTNFYFDASSFLSEGLSDEALSVLGFSSYFFEDSDFLISDFYLSF
jgi:hypothetical protein